MPPMVAARLRGGKQSRKKQLETRSVRNKMPTDRGGQVVVKSVFHTDVLSNVT